MILFIPSLILFFFFFFFNRLDLVLHGWCCVPNGGVYVPLASLLPTLQEKKQKNPLSLPTKPTQNLSGLDSFSPPCLTLIQGLE